MQIQHLIDVLKESIAAGYKNVVRANEDATRWWEFYTDHADTDDWHPSDVVITVVEKWIDATILPEKRELIIAHCPDRSPDEYQVCYHDWDEYTYEGIPNDMFNETVMRWKYLH